MALPRRGRRRLYRRELPFPGDAPGYITATSQSGPESKPSAAAALPWQPRPQIDENIAAARFFNLLFQYLGRAPDHAAAERGMRYLASPQVVHSRALWPAGILLADLETSSDPLHITIVGSKDNARAHELFGRAGGPGWIQTPGMVGRSRGAVASCGRRISAAKIAGGIHLYGERLFIADVESAGGQGKARNSINLL